MTVRKERLTVTVDAELLASANAAVAAGRADSLSAWVNRALADRLAREQRLAALGEAVAAYEVAFGAITPHELAAQARADRQRSSVIPAQPAPKPRAKRRRSRAA